MILVNVLLICILKTGIVFNNVSEYYYHYHPLLKQLFRFYSVFITTSRVVDGWNGSSGS